MNTFHPEMHDSEIEFTNINIIYFGNKYNTFIILYFFLFLTYNIYKY